MFSGTYSSYEKSVHCVHTSWGPEKDVILEGIRFYQPKAPDMGDQVQSMAILVDIHVLLSTSTSGCSEVFDRSTVYYFVNQPGMETECHKKYNLTTDNM